MGKHETFCFVDFSLLPQYLKAIIVAKFPGRGVLLHESKLLKMLLMLILQVQFNDGSSALLDKFDLPYI